MCFRVRIVRVHGASFSKDRFWDPENIADVRFKSDHEYVEAFQERLDAAVKASLRSCRTPCATITGGLDSSSIAVIAADMLAANGKKLNTFTAVPEAGFIKEETRGSYYDETPYVRQIAQANPNIIPHFIPPSKGPILEQIAEQIRLGGAPSGSILNGLWVMDILRRGAFGRPQRHAHWRNGQPYNELPWPGALCRALADRPVAKAV